MPASKESTSAQLIQDAQAKIPAAWDKLYHVYSPLVRRWVLQAGLPEADVADVTQEVFVRLARYLESYEYDREQARFRTWMRVVTLNCVRDCLRARRNKAVAQGGTAAHNLLQEIAEPETSDDDLSASQDDAFVTQRVLSLIQTDFTEATWQAFWRSTVNCESTASIAAELGLTEGAVRQAKSRVLRRLRQELAELK
ncbi:MAG: sigma-70 family RNA polymerase sigma factor [Planctomycetaceae bacterium]|nr:sigma-70 family RNA polymerase sigma factor [Planctomycetales bacterium]MCB9874147.1 sigma-70 family RNA polymerase sigma factor [Planctomycetaceae bacterium]MCB9940338.1 sigma-70 family RNA polymerase sigma factor [Planctomycetaceae bacterium]